MVTPFNVRGCFNTPNCIPVGLYPSVEIFTFFSTECTYQVNNNDVMITSSIGIETGGGVSPCSVGWS